MAAAPWRSPVGATPEGSSPAPFQAWCEQHKLTWPKCAISVSPTTGRCVVAAADIAAGEVVVSVPDDAVLMVENCSIAETLVECGLAKPADDAMLEVQGLVLAVMHEKAYGAASKWCDYLSFLPAAMEHMPLYWSDSELQELRGTVAFDKLHGRVQHVSDAPTKVLELFEELVLPFLSDHPDIAVVAMPNGDRDFAWELYRWATAAVASYSFILGDDHYQAMVPIWDALNHVTGAVNVRLHHDADGGALQMIATQDIAAGAEVVNNYGALSTSELLRCYGFVEMANPNNHAQVPAQFLLRAAAGTLPSTDGAGRHGSKRAREDDKGKGRSAGDEEGGEDDDDSSESESSDASERSLGSSSEAEEGEEEAEEEQQEEEEQEEEEEEGEEEAGSEAEIDIDLEDDTDIDEVTDPNNGGSTARANGAGPGPGSSSANGSSCAPGSSGRCSGHGTRLPSLNVAMDLMPDWEARWQLCSTLKLLPTSGVFKVGPKEACLPGDMAAMALVLLMSEQQCDEVGGLLQDWSQEQPAQDKAAEDMEAILPPAQRLMAALQAVMRLMLSRYTCSLDTDKQLLARLDSLPPCLQAAVVARSSEKECLHALRDVLQQEGAAERLRQQAADALLAAVLLRADKRRAKAAARDAAMAAPGNSDSHAADQAGPSGAHAGCDEHCHHSCHGHHEAAQKHAKGGGNKRQKSGDASDDADAVAAAAHSSKRLKQAQPAPQKVSFSFDFQVDVK